MAIRDVVTRGFGNGTFNPGVNKLPTRGYSISSVVEFGITSETTLVIARGSAKSRLTVMQAQDEIVLLSEAGLDISTETKLIETND
jgi:hypothetical protein